MQVAPDGKLLQDAEQWPESVRAAILGGSSDKGRA